MPLPFIKTPNQTDKKIAKLERENKRLKKRLEREHEPLLTLARRYHTLNSAQGGHAERDEMDTIKHQIFEHLRILTR